MPVRSPVALVCSECGARNYQTTRTPNARTRLRIKKFCAFCNHHTTHEESK
ncbi:MAG: 50S ribosomal protein L33 [Myxococcota bacterium]